MTIREIHQRLIKKEISVVELTEGYLRKIEREDKNIHSFLTLTPELALSQAKEAQKKINRGESVSFLCGIPCAIKDNILVEGIRCTAGSKILENYTAPYDATVIKKLKKTNVVILGKTNMDEFGMGSSTEYSAYGITRNPIDKARVPGGTSGGSAAAVAADFCQFALGSDTGGSIRQPASFCGDVGFRPTYGAVSRYGLIAFVSSMDQIGPIAKSIEDTKMIFDVIKGKDLLDSTSVESKVKSQKSKVKKLKVGIPKEYFLKGLERGVKDIIENVIKKIDKLGAKVQKISLPRTAYALASYYLIMPSEASSNLARFDGIKYGISASQISNLKSQNLIEFYSKVRGEKFGKEVKRRIILGTFALSAGYYNQYYRKAQKVRRLVRKDFDEAFQEVDLILTPTSPTVAFKIGEKIDDPIKMYLADIFTVGPSLAGMPALSVPCGFVPTVDSRQSEVKLPVGLQIVGRPFEESIFDLAKIIEGI